MPPPRVPSRTAARPRTHRRNPRCDRARCGSGRIRRARPAGRAHARKLGQAGFASADGRSCARPLSVSVQRATMASMTVGSQDNSAPWVRPTRSSIARSFSCTICRSSIVAQWQVGHEDEPAQEGRLEVPQQRRPNRRHQLVEAGVAPMPPHQLEESPRCRCWRSTG